jgi:magnesium chelatase subunit D
VNAGHADVDTLGDAWARARLAVELFAVHPVGLGGIRVRSRAGEARDSLIRQVADLLPAGAPILRVPIDVTSDRLLGGISLAATLREGRPVFERGVLARAHDGVLLLAMAERADAFVVSQVCAALDTGELSVERDGFATRIECRVGVVALDEGIDGEAPSAALTDRLAFDVELDGVDLRREPPATSDRARIDRARALVAAVAVDPVIVDTLIRAALALGVQSLRAVLLATETARACAALHRRMHVDESDAAVGAALVLGPRATRMPVPETREADEASQPDDTRAQAEQPPPIDTHERQDSSSKNEPIGALEDVLLQAVRSALPRGLLDRVDLGNATQPRSRAAGRSGAASASTQTGRPAGSRAGMPEGGARLHLIATLTAAAPWQRLRSAGHDQPSLRDVRVQIRKGDLRIVRRQHRRETLVIFTVDASGSAAAQRLAEAKGAVEQVLVECYARRDHVALLAFRGDDAPIALPPTRSLARARKSLAGLVGGGPTPIAAGIDAAVALATQARKSGKTPIVVLMTDARANVARDGSRGAKKATSDATASARAARAQGIVSLFLDTSPRPRDEARKLAAEMGAAYMPLPHMDAQGVARRIQSLAQGVA